MENYNNNLNLQPKQEISYSENSTNNSNSEKKSNKVDMEKFDEKVSKEIEKTNKSLRNLKGDMYKLKIYTYNELVKRANVLEEKAKSLNPLNEKNHSFLANLEGIKYLKNSILDLFNQAFKTIEAQSNINQENEKVFKVKTLNVHLFNLNCLIESKKCMKDTTQLTKKYEDQISEMCCMLQKIIEENERYLGIKQKDEKAKKNK